MGICMSCLDNPGYTMSWLPSDVNGRMYITFVRSPHAAFESNQYWGNMAEGWGVIGHKQDLDKYDLHIHMSTPSYTNTNDATHHPEDALTCPLTATLTHCSLHTNRTANLHLLDTTLSCPFILLRINLSALDWTILKAFTITYDNDRNMIYWTPPLTPGSTNHYAEHRWWWNQKELCLAKSDLLCRLLFRASSLHATTTHATHQTPIYSKRYLAEFGPFLPLALEPLPSHFPLVVIVEDNDEPSPFQIC